MKKLIYMSEELKRQKMDVSRSTIVQTNGKITYGGPLRIVDKEGNTLVELKIAPEGLQEAPNHVVKAWLETEYEVKPAN